MSDYGSRKADQAQKVLTRKLKTVYQQAGNEMLTKMQDFLADASEQSKQYLAAVEAGEMTVEQYQAWLRQKVFVGNVWKGKVQAAAEVMGDANTEALRLIYDQELEVFAQNANYAAYQIDTGTKVDTSFTIYDKDAVGRLVRDEPELLPRKVLDGVKDEAWNTDIISRVLTQGIVQGESIPDIARRLATETASTDMKAMTRYARTAMTCAQNAGRMETMHRAEDMGIKIRKVWQCTYDSRTREAHIELDGQERDVDEPFENALGEIMYPGDPGAEPGNVYNCRCTLRYIYPKYQASNGGSHITYGQWLEQAENMSRGW